MSDTTPGAVNGGAGDAAGEPQQPQPAMAPPRGAGGAAAQSTALTVIGGGPGQPKDLYGIKDSDLDASHMRAGDMHERYASGALITTADIVKRLSMVPLGPPTGKFSKPRGRKLAGGDSSEDDAGEEPPGSPAPRYFMASGPGLTGGAARVRAAVTVTARDAARRRVRDGGQGAEVTVTVRPARAAGGGGDGDIKADVIDRGDGSYIATYEVPERGNYNVIVIVEGEEIDGSPFPVFFSAHDDASSAAAAEAETANFLAAFGGAGGAPAAAAAAPKLVGGATAPVAPPAPPPGAPADPSAALAAAAAEATESCKALPETLAAAAKKLSVDKGLDAFPRCVCVWQFPGATIDAAALRQIMGVTGTVKDASVTAVPPSNEWLGFVEFGTADEARGALALAGTKLGDLTMQVCLAPPVTLQDVAATNPMLALQLQTMQRAQAAVAHQQALMAAMRKQIEAAGDKVRGGGGGSSSRRDRDRDRRRSRSRSRERARAPPAWLAARERGGGGGGGGGSRRSRSPAQRRRSPSPPRGYRGRGEPRMDPSGSYTRRRSRSRSRDRRRSRSRDRRRSRSRERSDKDRHRSRKHSRSRSRDHDRDRHHSSHHRSSRSSKHKEHRRRRTRSRSRSGERGGSKRREDEAPAAAAPVAVAEAHAHAPAANGGGGAPEPMDATAGDGNGAAVAQE